MFIVWSVLALALVACQSKSQQSGNNRRGSRSRGDVKERIDKDTDSLSWVTDWALAQKLYAQIKVDIERHVKSERVKNDMYGLLDKAYCHSMDTIMYGILTSNTCKNNHKLLEEVHTARVKGDLASISTNLYNEVDQLYKTHKEIQSFISNARRYRQDVHSYKDPYDTSTENKLKQSASNYLKKGMKCDELNTGLQSIANGSAFKDCHKDFCDKVVGLYINGGVYDADYHKKLLLKIKGFHELFRETNGEPLTDSATRWIESLKNFETEHTNSN